MLMRGETKMDSIDRKYYVNVKELHENYDGRYELPRPRRKLLTGDGEYLPIVTVECEK